ncbi:MAG TPA: hemerythrin domain-containing protein [Kofleriaceae bacterium]|nr:hemerythrin domain-containing protein [Kofleriaceae bacterium]
MNAQRSMQQYLDDQHALLELGLAGLEGSLAAGAFFDARMRLAGFRAHLGRYVRGEERVLFPIYEQLPAVPREPTARMRREHGHLRRMIARLGAIIDRKDAPRGLTVLGALRDVLFVHSVKEDWLIYPSLVDAMPAPKQDAIVRALRDGARFAS